MNLGLNGGDLVVVEEFLPNLRRAMLDKLDFVSQQEPVQAYLTTSDGTTARLFDADATLIMKFKKEACAALHFYLGFKQTNLGLAWVA